MKKRKLKKLELSKETLANLTSKDLTAVHGASDGLLTCNPNICYEMFASERGC